MNLEPTGERVVERHYQSSQENYLIYLFHIFTYDYVRKLTIGKTVLDFGSGSGYGAARIAEDCAKIVGVDVAEDAIEYANLHYRKENLAFQHVKPVDDEPLPFPEGTFDVVLSFQVIEHVTDVGPYLAEVKRVIKPSGVFVVATPDRTTRLLPFQKPWNMWHVREYTKDDVKKTLAPYFSDVEVQQMGGKEDIINIEISRTRKMMWTLLPFTLPFVPEVLRVAGLRAIKGIRARISGRGNRSSQEFDFDETALSISPKESPSVNLIAFARGPIEGSV